MVNKTYNIHLLREGIKRQLENKTEINKKDSTKTLFVFSKNKILKGSDSK
jgi:hypothetical protein